ncbi:hypothetical protein PSI15_14840, partial [Xenorhabdus sp. PR6a]|uniref:hypothetical protein n=1 Tax=Xenorhabdus sp. PR6a TaxID=3025877 RepID=UPI002359059B
MITNQGENNNGLSQYLRGTFLCNDRPKWPIQFIPVPTGNTTFLSVRTAIMTVYPRAYGEHGKTISIRFNNLRVYPRT